MIRLIDMVTVEMTSRLFRFLPALEHRTITVPAGSVGETLRAVDAITLGFSDYVLDERGALRQHVNLNSMTRW